MHGHEFTSNMLIVAVIAAGLPAVAMILLSLLASTA